MQISTTTRTHRVGKQWFHVKFQIEQTSFLVYNADYNVNETRVAVEIDEVIRIFTEFAHLLSEESDAKQVKDGLEAQKIVPHDSRKGVVSEGTSRRVGVYGGCFKKVEVDKGRRIQTESH